MATGGMDHEKRKRLQALINEAFGGVDLTPYTGQEWSMHEHGPNSAVLEVKLLTTLTDEQVAAFWKVIESADTPMGGE